MAPVTPLDWVLARMRGYGQMVFAVATAVDEALLESGTDKAVLVGHSSGGILCRAYVGGGPPFGGRRYSGHRRVSHLVTLGTPHEISDKKPLHPITEVNELFPGALHARSGLEYLSVAGAAVDGAPNRTARGRYEKLVEDGRTRGDGKVPVEAALLPGAAHLVLDDVYHDRRRGRPWYGSDEETVERWWPAGLRV